MMIAARFFTALVVVVMLAGCGGPGARVAERQRFDHGVKMKVPPGSIFTCSEYIDHPIDSRTKFSSDDHSIYVVVDLNSRFVDKEILIEVEKKETGALMAGFSCTWDNTGDTYAFRLVTRDLIEKGGFGPYGAACYVAGEKIAKAEFRITE